MAQAFLDFFGAGPKRGHLLPGGPPIPVSKELSIRAELLETGGSALADDFMNELRAIHLGTPLPVEKQSVLERLQAAYEQVVQENE